MKKQFIPVLVAGVFYIYVSVAQACSNPYFTIAITEPLFSKGILVNEGIWEFPGSDSLCIYTAVWTAETIDLGAKFKLYVATYHKYDQKMIADTTINSTVEKIWSEPTAHLDQTVFQLKEGVKAFGLTTFSTFLGGTFGEDNQQFDLIVDDGKGKLRSVLTTQTTHRYQRNCGDNCEEENAYENDFYVVSKNKTRGFFDVIRGGSVVQADSVPEPKVPTQGVLYRWNGHGYVQKK